MENEHLTYFKVENFKRFDSLELTDIGQFNLIVGDNNVGKTSLLEALAVLDKGDSQKLFPNMLLSNMGFMLVRRGIDVSQNSQLFLKYASKRNDLPIRILGKTGIFEIDVQIKNNANNGLDASVSYEAGEPSVIEGATVYANLSNNSLVPANIKINGELVGIYQRALLESIQNKQLIIDNLKSIDKSIFEIEVLPLLQTQHVMVGLKNNAIYLPITALGESAVRVFYYLLHIVLNSNKRLFIDEIDTGIHYSRMKSFLKNIIQLALRNNVQLFITTHSSECQQAFVDVFEEEGLKEHQDKVRQFSLIDSVRENKVVALNRKYHQLENSLEIGFDTRGGNPTW